MNSSFDQIFQIERFIIQEGEQLRVDLDKYYRGHLLEFDMNGDSEAKNQLLDQKVISLQKAMKKVLTKDIHDGPDPLSAHRTQLIIYDEQDNTFFMFLDADFNIVVYDISKYDQTPDVQ